ncbi:NAC transcription factor [Actinidia chinensis var. chinensis]|uniref:NAC transcription factor n=1 Tax=Actinidia chinensis var. chinensis TaxID=1590841 RepID=A0A2R6Q2H8_ACTCC|nr:NAC transcription factor [Actinidia chinensis var. chinensis]
MVSSSSSSAWSSIMASSASSASSSHVNAIEQLNGQTIYLPTGYRFDPSDEQIVIHYLMNEIRNQPLPVDIIPRINVYSCSAPEKIPLSTSKYGMENHWYFFTTRPKENPIITSDGCWKEIRDEEILDGDEVVGFMRTLRFHYEELLNDEANTNWYIDEYSANPNIFESDELDDDAKEKVSNFVVCKVRFGESMADKTCDADSNEGDINSDSDSHKEGDTDSDTESDSDSDTKSDSDSDTESDSDSVEESDSDTDSDKERNINTDSDEKSNIDIDTNSDEERDIDTDTNSDEESDTNSYEEEEERPTHTNSDEAIQIQMMNKKKKDPTDKEVENGESMIHARKNK